MATRRVELRWPLLAHPLLVGAAIVLVVGALRAAYEARDVLLLGFFAVLIAVVFSYPVQLFCKVMPRGLAVLLTLGLALGVVAGVGLLAAPVVTRQAQGLMKSAPQGITRARAWISGRDRSSPVAQLQGKEQVAQKVDDQVGQAVSAVASRILPAAISATSAVVAGVLLLVLAAFLVHEPEVYKRGLRLLVPKSHEAVFDEAWQRVGRDLRAWVGGIAVSMSLMGTVCAAGLALAGVDGWFLLGLLTFFGTFIPYAGALASAIPGLFVALAQGPRQFFLAGAVYLAVHILEGYIVEPLVMKRAVELRPALLLFGQSLFGALFGVMGIAVATPLMVAGRALIDYLWVERRLGKDPSAT